MPQAPSLPRQPTNNDHMAGERAGSSASASAAGNLPGGTPVQARTMAQSALLALGVRSNIPGIEPQNRSGTPDHSVDFNAHSYSEASKKNPALWRPAIRAVMASTTELKEVEDRMRATQHALQVRRSANLSGRMPPIRPASAAYRDYGKLPIRPSHPDYANQTISQRFLRLRTTVQTFLAEAGLPSQPEDWSPFTIEDLENAFRGAPNYYVRAWEPGYPVEDQESLAGQEQYDQQVGDEWKNGFFDRESGATFIQFNHGRECIVWLNDRTAGYNLRTGEIVTGVPSEVYRTLEANRPDVLRGLDQLLVAPPTVSNALHALQNIAPEKAHRLLAAHCKANGGVVTEMGFDEFGRVVQSHYPNAVVARYDRQSTDLQSLGSVLDAFEGRLFLVKLNNDGTIALQDKFSLCFNGPGVKPSLNGKRTSNFEKDDKATPRSETPSFRRFNWTPQQYLESARQRIFFRTPRDGLPLPDTMRRIPRANDSRLYNPSDYSGTALKYEKPSVILQQHFHNCDQIGLISTGALQAAVAPDEAGLARLAEAWQAGYLVTCLQYAGIEVEAPSELVSPVYQTHGIWPELNVSLIKRCIESRNSALPPHKKIKVSLDVIASAADLPEFGQDPAGYMLQFRQSAQLCIVFFYKSHGIAVFRGVSGDTYRVAELGDVARDEGWWSEGPVSLLHFEGEDVSPLIEVEELREESQQEDGPEEDRKRKRRSLSSIASTGSDLAMRPKKKVERLTQDPASQPDSSQR